MIKIDNNIQSTLKFVDYVVDEVSYTTNKNFEEKPVQLDIKLGKEIAYSEEQNKLLVTLKCRVFEEVDKNNFPFSLYIQVTGNFEINGVFEGNLENMAHLNAVSILFPYVRSLITTLTSNFNVQPLILPPINVNKLFEIDN